jgi:hypothetical protein
MFSSQEPVSGPNPSLTNETFKLPEDYDYVAQTDGSYFGVFIDEKRPSA